MRIFYGIGFAAFGISFIILILNTERLNKIFSQEHVVHEDDGDGMENSYLVRKNIASFKVRETKVTEKDFRKNSYPAIRLGTLFALGPGDASYSLDAKIPMSKFFVFFAEKDRLCIFSSCRAYDWAVKQIGGWFEVENTNYPTIKKIFNMSDGDQYEHAQSLLIITNAKSAIVGIYPDVTLKDFIPILELHPDLVDFSLIKTAF